MPETADLHRGLQRQLRRLGLSAGEPPDPAKWAKLLDTVSGSYKQTDEERYTMERSIEVSAEEMRALHEVLSRQATRDALTGLPNRSALTEVLQDTLARCRRNASDMAVLFLDLDGFKLVNDSLGHSAGDDLLVRAAERICAAVRDNDIVARLGGDEFVVVCVDVDGIDTATRVARRIAERLEPAFRIAGQDSVISASIGIALASHSRGTPDDILRHADMAMYVAKSSGRRQFAIFDDVMRERVERQLSTENALRHAVSADELALHYQPIVRLSDERLIGFEALARWNRPGHGLVRARDFIPAAEESHLITVIDAWVIRNACEQAARWHQRDVTVSVNLSARDLKSAEIVDNVSVALQRSGLASRRLIFEITETALVSGSAAIAANLDRLRALGVQFAIDDFGTGYSSFAYLRKVPAQTLKIDSSFISELGEDGAATAIVEAIVHMGHALGLKIVAEGVERSEQADRLRALGCDAGQGYLFGEPRPVSELAARGERPAVGSLSGS
jgi:diguanylate cyclase